MQLNPDESRRFIKQSLIEVLGTTTRTAEEFIQVIEKTHRIVLCPVDQAKAAEEVGSTDPLTPAERVEVQTAAVAAHVPGSVKDEAGNDFAPVAPADLSPSDAVDADYTGHEDGDEVQGGTPMTADEIDAEEKNSQASDDQPAV